MADPKPSNTVRKKRQVKTVREQRELAQTASTQTKRTAKVTGYVSKALSIVVKPFKKFFGLKIWKAKAFAPLRFLLKILSYVLFIPYLKGSWQEVRLVTWPNWNQTWRLTWAVLVFSIFFGVIVAIVDYGLDKVFKQLILNS